jgi:amino acid transporter
VLRKQLPDRERPYRLPAGQVIAPLSFVVASLIIYWAGWATLWRLGVAIILGYALLGSYAWYARAKNLPNAPQLDWKAAQWLPVYLVGIGVISWQGGFGVGSEGHIHLWWDMGLIAVFSLAVYYWALAVGLKREAIERNIDEVAVVDEGGH